MGQLFSTTRYRNLAAVLGCLMLSCLSSGCYGPITPSFYTETVGLRVDMDANNDSATAVDLVVIYDESLLKDFVAMPSDKYFANAKQFRRDYPQQVEIFHWEVVPGQMILSERLHYKRSSPLAAYVYARYIAPGDHRIRIGSQEYLMIHLKKDSFDTASLEKDDSSLVAPYKEPE
jgi:type VI secretion system protein